MKSNGTVLLLLLYLTIFGLQVKINNPVIPPMDIACKTLENVAPEPVPRFPIIDKENMANKEYLIRMLIGHIKTQEEYILLLHKNLTHTQEQYQTCIGR